jgi:hypothetical protein
MHIFLARHHTWYEIGENCVVSDQLSHWPSCSPDGDFSQHLRVMKAKADSYAVHLRSPKLTASDIRIFHRTIYAPAMKYSLPAVAVDKEAFAPVQSRILTSILNGLGVSRTIPTAIRHGPAAMGGLDLLDLQTESGISSLKLFRDSVFSMSETGKMILINLHYSQLESGLGTPLLASPSVPVSYLTPTWVTSVRQFLFNIIFKFTLRTPRNICFVLTLIST